MTNKTKAELESENTTDAQQEGIRDLHTTAIEVRIGGKKDKDGNKTKATKYTCYVPSLLSFNDVVSGSEGDELADFVALAYERGARSMLANDIRCGYEVPTTAAMLIANIKEKAEKSANRGEALAVRRASLDAFYAYLKEQGVTANGISVAEQVLYSNATIAVSSVARRTAVVARLEAWAEVEGVLAEHEKLLVSLDDAFAKAEQADAIEVDL